MSGRHQPSVGEIWWAVVPYQEGTGVKRRPCQILRIAGERVQVVKITSTDLTGHRRCRRILVPGYRRPSWVDRRRRIWLPVAALERRCR